MAHVGNGQSLEDRGVETVPGDRHPDIRERFPAEAYYHNGQGGRILDVTKPPFNAVGDGMSDDTAALCAALRFVQEHTEVTAGEDYSLCANRFTSNWIVYLPAGEYRISDTVSRGWPTLAMHIRAGWSKVNYFPVRSPEEEEVLQSKGKVSSLLHGNPVLPATEGASPLCGQYNDASIYAENNWALRVIGECRETTVIRLIDQAPGFDGEEEKAVLSFYNLRCGSNVNIGNYCENLTIDTGAGNPAAVGLKWNSSNHGGVRNVAIRSQDGQGRAGLVTDANNATGYHHDLFIDGFDTGIRIQAGRETMVTLEYATLCNQKKRAIALGDANSGAGGDSLSARKVRIENAPVGLRAGRAGQAIVLESSVECSDQTGDRAFVIEEDGFLHLRDVNVCGYKTGIDRYGRPEKAAERIERYISTPCQSGEPPEGNLQAFPHLPVADTPLPENIAPEDWANVDHFGAVGDGRTDDTVAIQRAMDAGKAVVYFPKANYVVNGTVRIPAHVKEVTWLFGAVHRSESAAFDAPALFSVAEGSSEPLILRRGITAGGVFLDHEADRPVVLEDIHVWFHHARGYMGKDGMLLPTAAAQETEIWRLYRNTTPEGAPKRLFVNNSLYFAGDNEQGTLAVENVQVWARMINTEHLPGALYSFKRSQAWIFGFKSEVSETLLKATDGSTVEILGGSFLNFSERSGPAVVTCDSSAGVIAYLWHWVYAPETLWHSKGQGGELVRLASDQIRGLRKVDAAVLAVAWDGSDLTVWNDREITAGL